MWFALDVIWMGRGGVMGWRELASQRVASPGRDLKKTASTLSPPHARRELRPWVSWSHPFPTPAESPVAMFGSSA